MKSQEITRILIADDHPVIREGLRVMIEKRSQNHVVVAEASDGESALRKILEYKPDMVFTDLSMPKRNGLDVVEKVLRRLPETIFVVLTMHNNPHHYKEALKAGVMGYLLKDHALTEIEDCIEALTCGQYFVSRYMKHDCYEHKRVLTRREKEILKGLLVGASNYSLAEKLFCSTKNVERLKTGLRKKLDLPCSRSSLISWAMENRDVL